MEVVGFIGVGAMGGAIAERLVQRGVEVHGYDINPETLKTFARAGGRAANSTKQVVDQCEVVFACLPNADICKEVAFAPAGVEGGERVKIYVETSTIGVSVARELAERLGKKGITLIDAPVVGAQTALAAGTLGVLASGPRVEFERVKPILECFAGKLFHLGTEPGMGQSAKVMSNSVTWASVLATCEALAVGMKAGIDLETAIAVINQGSGANFFSQRVVPQTILRGKLSGTGAIEISVKDVALFIEEAKRLHTATPVAGAISSIQHDILKSGPGGRDAMTVVNYFMDLAQLPRIG